MDPGYAGKRGDVTRIGIGNDCDFGQSPFLLRQIPKGENMLCRHGLLQDVQPLLLFIAGHAGDKCNRGVMAILLQASIFSASTP